MRTRLTVVEEHGLFAKARQGPIALGDDRGFERHRPGDHLRSDIRPRAADYRQDPGDQVDYTCCGCLGPPFWGSHTRHLSHRRVFKADFSQTG
jgi:hypothetical protein